MSDGRAGRMTEDDAVREQFTGDGIMSVFSAPTWVNWLRMPPGLARLQKLLQRLIPYLTGFFPGTKLTRERLRSSAARPGRGQGDAGAVRRRRRGCRAVFRRSDR
jgi:hypothetical protein